MNVHIKVAGLIGVAAAATAAVVVPVTASAHAAPTTPIISNVTFDNGSTSGSPTALVTITGSGFGNLPNPKPAGNPQSYRGSGCFGVTPGYDGLDFGSNLIFGDNTATWEAGFGASATSGNCIGLVIWRYSRVKITYGFGVVYGGSLVLHNGDNYVVNVRGASFSGTVSGL
jgi:hypothetical protein